MGECRGPPHARRNSANVGPRPSAPAEEAFFKAIAIAQAQIARSFGLRAALWLAKLYQSAARAPPTPTPSSLLALEGFAPTSEYPEIEEALALLTSLEARAHL